MIKGKQVLVTGASSGIGAAVARRLAASGAHLIVLGRSGARLRSALKRAGSPASVQYVAVDLSKPGHLRRCVSSLRRRLSGLDGIVHAAGVFSMVPLRSAKRDPLQQLMQVNVSAALTLTLGLLAHLKRRSGSVVFINSTAVQRPARNAPFYAASKHALRSIADSLREEVNALGIRVSSIYPGRTATPMQKAIVDAEGRSYRPSELIQPEDIALLVEQLLDLPASIEVTEIFTRPTQPPR
jgi:NADP-dependent 3-hydroxy acid dehydrogenase YdfG